MVRTGWAGLTTATIFFLAGLHASAVGGEIRVQGSLNEVRVEARDATGSEILAALADHFALSYRGTTANRRVSGTFEGPLSEVVKRVLDGYSFVINRNGDGLKIIVVSPASTIAVPPPRPTPRGRQE